MEPEPANRDRDLFTWEGVREKNRSPEMLVLTFWTAAFKKDIFTVSERLFTRWYSKSSQYLQRDQRAGPVLQSKLPTPLDPSLDDGRSDATGSHYQALGVGGVTQNIKGRTLGSLQRLEWEQARLVRGDSRMWSL